jgi:hypothetical protein
MVRPGKTHHERALEHLRTAAKHLDANRAKVEESLQAHLDKNPVVPITSPEKESNNATQDSN